MCVQFRIQSNSFQSTTIVYIIMSFYENTISIIISSLKKEEEEEIDFYTISVQDSHSDHLIKLFDQTLSTVTPVRDSTNDDNSGIGSRYRRGQPLPLILSDSSHEDDMPVLTLNDSDLSSNETKVEQLIFIYQIN